MPAGRSSRTRAATRRSNANAAQRRAPARSFTPTALAPTAPRTGGPSLHSHGRAPLLPGEPAATLYIGMEGRGITEFAGRIYDWQTNDIFAAPGFSWRRHSNKGEIDALLYAVSDAPLIEKIG